MSIAGPMREPKGPKGLLLLLPPPLPPVLTVTGTSTFVVECDCDDWC
jgi:hypothetical protein